MIMLGDKVEDLVSGIVGTAVARVEYLNGCVQYCVQPRNLQGAKALSIDSFYIDQSQLKKIDNGINKEQPKEKSAGQRSGGGPSAHTPKGLAHP